MKCKCLKFINSTEQEVFGKPSLLVPISVGFLIVLELCMAAKAEQEEDAGAVLPSSR